jgi:hypothetical protein
MDVETGHVSAADLFALRMTRCVCIPTWCGVVRCGAVHGGIEWDLVGSDEILAVCGHDTTDSDGVMTRRDDDDDDDDTLLHDTYTVAKHGTRSYTGAPP